MFDNDAEIFDFVKNHLYTAVVSDVLDALGYKRFHSEIGEAKVFTADEIKHFDAENQRLKQEVLSKVDPEDMKRRDQQAAHIKAIKDRQANNAVASV